jgi:hypothetical protein
MVAHHADQNVRDATAVDRKFLNDLKSSLLQPPVTGRNRFLKVKHQVGKLSAYGLRVYWKRQIEL